MVGGAGARPRRRSWWLIVSQEGGFLGLLALGIAGGERVVPVFSFEEEAELFLRLGVPGSGWLVRETGAGELASLLSGPLSGAGRVALDPLPGWLAEGVVGLVSTRRKDFVARLLGGGGGGLEARPRRGGDGGRGGDDGGEPDEESRRLG